MKHVRSISNNNSALACKRLMWSSQNRRFFWKRELGKYLKGFPSHRGRSSRLDLTADTADCLRRRRRTRDVLTVSVARDVGDRRTDKRFAPKVERVKPRYLRPEVSSPATIELPRPTHTCTHAQTHTTLRLGDRCSADGDAKVEVFIYMRLSPLRHSASATIAPAGSPWTNDSEGGRTLIVRAAGRRILFPHGRFRGGRTAKEEEEGVRDCFRFSLSLVFFLLRNEHKTTRFDRLLTFLPIHCNIFNIFPPH